MKDAEPGAVPHQWHIPQPVKQHTILGVSGNQMGRKLTAFEKELYKRTDEVMHYVWDPIGVSGIPSGRDEYDSYVAQVFGLLLTSERASIAGYLAQVEEERIGLTPNMKKAEEVAEILLDWREVLCSKYED